MHYISWLVTALCSFKVISVIVWGGKNQSLAFNNNNNNNNNLYIKVPGFLHPSISMSVALFAGMSLWHYVSRSAWPPLMCMSSRRPALNLPIASLTVVEHHNPYIWFWLDDACRQWTECQTPGVGMRDLVRWLCHKIGPYGCVLFMTRWELHFATWKNPPKNHHVWSLGTWNKFLILFFGE